jgi:diguanylate cyclase (GGDEF)-like protein
MFKIKFIRNILLASLSIAIIMPLYNIFIAYPSFISALKEDVTEDSIRTAGHLMSMLNIQSTELNKDFFRANQDIIETIRKNLNIIKIKVFSPSGEVIYSTDSEDMGSINKKQYFHEIVVKGQTHTKVVQKDTRSLEGQLMKADNVETYVPIMNGDRFLGAFEIYYDITSKKERFDQLRSEAGTFIVVLAFGLVSLVIIASYNASRNIAERKQVEKELSDLVITDKLTRAYNRTKFEEIIPVEMERARRFNHPLSLLIFDIDHFKKINDTFGHLFGDYVLKTIADIVREHMRKVNYFIRWGGEEFMIIAIETNFEDGKILSERLRKEVEGYSFDKTDKITVSFGVTQFKEDDTLDTFIKRADDALYQAKEKGRNRVEGIV